MGMRLLKREMRRVMRYRAFAPSAYIHTTTEQTASFIDSIIDFSHM